MNDVCVFYNAQLVIVMLTFVDLVHVPGPGILSDKICYDCILVQNNKSNNTIEHQMIF